MTDNRALWDLVEEMDDEASELRQDGNVGMAEELHIYTAKLREILERPVVGVDFPSVSHTVEEVMEFADLLDKHYGAFMQKPIQMLLNYAALIGTQGLTQPDESMVRGKS